MNNISISPPGAKFAYISLKVYIDSVIVLGVYHASDDYYEPHSGQCRASFIYTESSSFVIGKDSCNYYGYIQVENWNCNFAKGWNSIYKTYTVYKIDSCIITSNSSLQPQTLKWYLASMW
jgi:hypothetical protein